MRGFETQTVAALSGAILVGVIWSAIVSLSQVHGSITLLPSIA